MKLKKLPDPAVSAKEPEDIGLTSDESLQKWNERVIKGMNRMDQDEAFRIEVEKKIS